MTVLRALPTIVFRLILVILLLGIGSWPAAPALASFSQEVLPSNIILYRSRISLRDQAGHAWQVVLFRTGQPADMAPLSLRLVGFPGIVQVAHPYPLQIEAAGDRPLEAQDMFAHQAPSPNVGQYDLTPIFAQLPTNRSVTLTLPVSAQEPLVLRIPPFVLQEWQQVAHAP